MSDITVHFRWEKRPDGTRWALLAKDPCTGWALCDVPAIPAKTLDARRADAEKIARRAMEFAFHICNNDRRELLCLYHPVIQPPLSSTHSTFRPKKKP